MERRARIVEEERFAFFAVMSGRIVLTVVAYSTADALCRLVDGGVEVAPGGVLITRALYKHTDTHTYT